MNIDLGHNNWPIQSFHISIDECVKDEDEQDYLVRSTLSENQLSYCKIFQAIQSQAMPLFGTRQAQILNLAQLFTQIKVENPFS